MKLCPNCNTQNADVYTQCVGCGAVLPSAPPQPIYSGNPDTADTFRRRRWSLSHPRSVGLAGICFAAT